MPDALSLPLLHPLVRAATPADVPRLRALILDLATYERAAHEVRVTEDQLHTALFGDQPAVYSLIADSAVGRHDAVGCAVYFLSFSTWEGTHGIYLEDLYVEDAQRGRGLGKALLQSLAAVAVARRYARFEWSVLDWNSPSIEFYRALGAEAMSEWTMYRLSGSALAAAARW